jgi:hypothetical protein
MSTRSGRKTAGNNEKPTDRRTDTWGTANQAEKRVLCNSLEVFVWLAPHPREAQSGGR